MGLPQKIRFLRKRTFHIKPAGAGFQRRKTNSPLFLFIPLPLYTFFTTYSSLLPCYYYDSVSYYLTRTTY